MRNLLVIIYFAVLVQWAGAQDTSIPDMNFNVSFSSLNGESSNVVWYALCRYDRAIRVPSYIPGAPIYTNDLEIIISFAQLPESAWIVEKAAHGTFKTITEITNGINGDNNNFSDQRFTLTEKQVHHLIKGDWYLEADYADNMFIGHLEPQYDTALGPTAVIQIESPFFERFNSWGYSVIAKDNQKAVVVFDSSHSTDPFYLPMQFRWTGLEYFYLTFTNYGATMSHTFALGSYHVFLSPSDSIARGKTSNIILGVITASQAVSDIVLIIPYLSVSDKQVKELNEILSIASNYFDRGNMAMGCLEMSIFIRQVHATHANNETASSILKMAQKIIESVGNH